MERIYLEYYVEYQYVNGIYGHLVCKDYDTQPSAYVFHCYDTYGDPYNKRISLKSVISLTIKTIDKKETVFSYVK